MMKIYLAARYSRRLELCEVRERLQKLGHTVTSRWLNGDHQISNEGTPIGEGGEALVESASPHAAELRQKFAGDDFADVLACDLLIAFMEPPRSSASRGGRHVELGLALGMMKRVWVIGWRENIFCWLEDVRWYESADAAIATLEHQAKEKP